MSLISQPCQRPLLTWSLLLWHAAVSTGIPVPRPASALRSGERFPCERCACGCLTAEQCWRDCCCFNNRQRVAWGQQHGVPVPAYVQAAALREEATTEKPRCPHCVSHAVAPSKIAHAGRRPNLAQERQRAPRRPAVICWLDVLRCQGVSAQGLTGVAVCPVIPRTTLHLVLLPLGRVVSESVFQHLLTPPEPPTPPPRSHCCRAALLPVLNSNR